MRYVMLESLVCEYKKNPVGIDAKNPRLSWKIKCIERDFEQKAFQIQVSGSEAALLEGKELLWDSTRVESSQSIHIRYNGAELCSGQRCYWRVRIWDQKDGVSDWSEISYWEMGLLNESDWKAGWIKPGFKQDKSVMQPCPLFRTEFSTDGEIASARAYITALGLYEARLNGNRVGDQLLTPGYTNYRKRLQYQTYDVTGMLNTGANAIGVYLGDGWYKGNALMGGNYNLFGSEGSLLIQVVIKYKDGRVQYVTSDKEWKSITGPILMSDIFKGETYDARLEKTGWDMPGYDDQNWYPAKPAKGRFDILVAGEGVPVRGIQEIKPLKLLDSPRGGTIVDMGQNMVGWVRLAVSGKKGTEITVRHAEVLDSEGCIYTANLRGADQTVKYILKGEGCEVYTPHFTFQGFRYLLVEGYPGNLTPDKISGIVIHSDLELTGAFTCSNPLINQLQHNILWSQKGNFVDVPTDCPQRDERLGWLGDAQVFIKTACFNMNVAPFYTKWLEDVKSEQLENGSLPHVAPNAIAGRFGYWPEHGSSGWGDASTVCPWTIYMCYGDRSILERQYSTMKGWVDYIGTQTENHIWNKGFHFGDWLALDGQPESNSRFGGTTFDLLATAYYALSVSIVVKTSRVLEIDNDTEKYSEILRAIKEAFRGEFLTKRGRLSSNTQTSYVLALMFDLLEEPEKQLAVKRLVNDIKLRNNRLTTGFLGTPHLTKVLSENGYLDMAYDLLTREEFPSWLYPVKLGATTIWERWDGIKPDGSFQDYSMNSFNQYAYGSIGDWMYRTVAGINTDEAQPGYKKVLIRPQPGGGLTSARGELESMYGRIVVDWTLGVKEFNLYVEVPANTTAEVYIPCMEADLVTEGGVPLGKSKGIAEYSNDKGCVCVKTGSGKYTFKAGQA